MPADRGFPSKPGFLPFAVFTAKFVGFSPFFYLLPSPRQGMTWPCMLHSMPLNLQQCPVHEQQPLGLGCAESCDNSPPYPSTSASPVHESVTDFFR